MDSVNGIASWILDVTDPLGNCKCGWHTAAHWQCEL